jgi:glutamyl-tRNA synthetase/glutamyl-Q tRNA(Asp) synthetase
VLLRIEDHDRQRSRLDYERAIRDDLDWLGFVADEDAGRQSECSAIYEAALAGLRSTGLVYACECSRAEIESAPPVGSALRRSYPGTCRFKSLPERPGLGVRIHLEPSVERFADLCHGAQEQRPFEQCGDLLARDREGNWTYQFAVSVDDLRQNITHVIRGDDLLDSTGRQLQLARLLGREQPPIFLHHSLVMKSATQKLSKADRDTSVRDLRSAGRSAAEVIGEAARLANLIERPRPVTAVEAATLTGHCGRSVA